MIKHVYYFSYGSNMSISRLKKRAPSASPLGSHSLKRHDLRFHKSSKDGSGKCDAYFTDNESDVVYGALFEMDIAEKPSLDRAEGLGYGYKQKKIIVVDSTGGSVCAITYVATNIDETLKPYSWYLNHVLIGAKETKLPDVYIDKKIQAVQAIDDPDMNRNAEQRNIHK